MDTSDDILIREIRRIALTNAIAYQGRAHTKPVLGKLLGERPELRRRINEIALLIDEIVQEVNNITLREQKEIINRLQPETPTQTKEKVKEKKSLPPLPNLEGYKQIITRFSPNPDCVIHLGSARAIILSHEYARIYQGQFILRFEDTDPRLKKSALQFFNLIRNDLKWLECNWDAEFIQSDRLEIYYEYARNLLEKGRMYICTCKPEEFREHVRQKQPCPCRDLRPSENMSRWDAMLEGGYREGEAVVRVKTELEHPNPAIREWPAFRIIDTKRYMHARVGDKYRVWPLYNFACGIDDHLMGITHIIRGKEHLTNQRRQEYIYRYLGWKYPEAIHYGRLKIEGASLSKSKILRGVKEGAYSGWDDPRLATFLALRRRGITPEAIRRLIIDIGPRPADITLSWENLYAYNRKIVDPLANRFFFVKEPVELFVEGVQKDFTARIPLHPSHPDRGYRQLEVKKNPKKNEAYLLISKKDQSIFEEDSVIRLMELFNVQVVEIEKDKVVAKFHSEPYEEARRLGAPLIHWLPNEEMAPCEVVMPDGTSVKGIAEKTFQDAFVNQIVQFERFGFVRVDKKENKMTVFFGHR